jgi:hypothetical protein
MSKPKTAAVAETNGRATETPPTAGLLSAARRVKDYQREARGLTRQLDIMLRATPIAGVPFRVWPNPADEFPVAILRVKNDSDRSDTYLLTPEVADLHYVAAKVSEGMLVPCITTTGKLYVWARTIPDRENRMAYRIHEALVRVCERARKGWVSIGWSPTLTLEEPRDPITDEPAWPTGQPLEEIYEIAARGVLINDPSHPVIRNLDTRVISRED